jgi:hypothetical protein
MKRLLILALVLIFIFNSCKKDSSNPTNINTIPSVPALLSPADSSIKVYVPAIFKWHASSGAASYTLQVSADSSLKSFTYNKSGLTDTSQQVTGLSNSTNYYWRVCATNSNETSAWSNV